MVVSEVKPGECEFHKRRFGTTRSQLRELNQWLTETHNLAGDYEKAYGRPAPRVKGIRLQINTQHTGTFAESCFGVVAFRSAPQS